MMDILSCFSQPLFSVDYPRKRCGFGYLSALGKGLVALSYRGYALNSNLVNKYNSSPSFHSRKAVLHEDKAPFALD